MKTNKFIFPNEMRCGKLYCFHDKEMMFTLLKRYESQYKNLDEIFHGDVFMFIDFCEKNDLEKSVKDISKILVLFKKQIGFIFVDNDFKFIELT